MRAETSKPIRVRILNALNEVGADQWDACAGVRDPFVGHAFLSALEDSGSAAPDVGWAAQHLVADGPDGRPLACAPMYLKTHSYGEYVFDWDWADAFERAGGRYYPKLQCAVPFTPATGPRLLRRPDAPAELGPVLVQAMIERAGTLGLSSVHMTFPERAECALAAEAGFLPRLGVQYHWHNQGYRDFEAFLDRLTARKRKAIRKERRAVAEQGIRMQRLTGSDIRERHWDAFYRFYLNTSDRKWGPAYLNRDFFSLLGERLNGRVLLVVAEKTSGGDPVAGALNLIGADALYGRNWGCSAEYRFLHFEACYYQAIDHAIETGLNRVEAGAQGPHKIRRGYRPEPTCSAHWIAHPDFRAAVAGFLDRETAAVEQDIEAMRCRMPYRSEPGDGP